MFLAQSSDAIGLRFAVIGLFVSHLPFNPVELVEELQCLRGRPALFLPGLEGGDEASPGVRHASDVRCTLQVSPGLIAVAHHNAAIVTKESLRMRLPTAGLIFEQYNWLKALLSAAIGSDVGFVGCFPALFLQHLHRGLVTMDDSLRQERLLQGIVDANEVLFA